MRGRKPRLTTNEEIKLRTLKNVYGPASPEVVQFWENKRSNIRPVLSTNTRRGERKHHECYRDAHNYANRLYYERNRALVCARQREGYRRRKEAAA